MDGYGHYIAMSELWTLKTPFYAFYSKQYSSAVVPLMEELQISGGHVTCLHQVLILEMIFISFLTEVRHLFGIICIYVLFVQLR